MSEQQDLRIAGISLDCRDPALLAVRCQPVDGGLEVVDFEGHIAQTQPVSDVMPTWSRRHV